MDTVLELENVSVHFDTPDGTVQAVRDVSLSLKSGETLAIVGESGCGKSVLCKSVMKLLPGNARISGKMLIDGKDIAPYTEKQMRKLRGSLFSMLFQDPMTTLNPTIPIGKQITEAVLKHRKMSREDAQKLAVEMLHRVGIDDPAQRMLLQPHYFSGGMRQRCVLAIALALNPHILFADEPTTALDVTVQAQMLDLLRDIQRKTGIGIVLVSHDLGVVARIADRVAVMYAGKIVEIGTAEEIFYDPRHPYTWGLLGALPSQAVENGELRGIPGMPPTLLDPPPGDAFAERNQYAMKIDYERMPPMFPVSETHSAATWLLDERAPAVTRLTLQYLKRMFLPWMYTASGYAVQELVTNRAFFVAACGILGCGLLQKAAVKIMPRTEKFKNSTVELVFCMLLLVYSVMLMVSSTYSAFIYMNF